MSKQSVVCGIKFTIGILCELDTNFGNKSIILEFSERKKHL